MKKIARRLLLIMAIAAWTSGCTATPKAEPAHPNFDVGIRDAKRQYPAVDPSGLSLRLISSPVVAAGKTCQLTFAVRNDSQRQILVDEWLREEPDNLLVCAQPCLTDMNAPDADGWIRLEFERKKPVYHFPLRLMPGNQVLIAKELPFIKNLRLQPGTERRYFLRAESALASLKLASEVIVLRVVVPGTAK